MWSFRFPLDYPTVLIDGEREIICDHPHGFPYRGSIPCTGPRMCRFCGMYFEDLNPSEGRND
jgi:hypothetical protein